MGPLVPSLILLSPGLIFAAWWFRSTAVIKGVPLISVLFVIAALWIVFDYHRHYASFAKNDPDRLQSEEYRYETARMQMIGAKELRNLTPEAALSLEAPRENLAALEPSSEEDESPAPSDTDEETAS